MQIKKKSDQYSQWLVINHFSENPKDYTVLANSELEPHAPNTPNLYTIHQ